MRIKIEGININYITEGSGPCVLLLHGWGANIDTMLPIFNILKDNFKVYAIDFKIIFQNIKYGQHGVNV